MGVLGGFFWCVLEERGRNENKAIPKCLNERFCLITDNYFFDFHFTKCSKTSRFSLLKDKKYSELFQNSL